MSDTTVKPELERRIVRHIDGELNCFEEAALERDLLRDPDARRLMEQYAWADQQVGDALAAAMESRRDENGKGPVELPDASPRIRWSRGLGFAGALAASVLLALVIWGQLRTADKPEMANSGQRQVIPQDQSPTSAGSAAAGQSADAGRVLPVGSSLAGAWDGFRRSASDAQDGLGRMISWIGDNAASTQVARAQDGAPRTSRGAIDQVPADTFGPTRGQRTIQRRLIGVVDSTGSQLFLLEVNREQTAVAAQLADL